MSWWLWCPLQGLVLGWGHRGSINPPSGRDAMAELVGETVARMTSPGPSSPSLWGHPGLKVVQAALPCPRGCNTLPVSEAGTAGCAWCCS